MGRVGVALGPATEWGKAGAGAALAHECPFLGRVGGPGKNTVHSLVSSLQPGMMPLPRGLLGAQEAGPTAAE